MMASLKPSILAALLFVISSIDSIPVPQADIPFGSSGSTNMTIGSLGTTDLHNSSIAPENITASSIEPTNVTSSVPSTINASTSVSTIGSDSGNVTGTSTLVSNSSVTIGSTSVSNVTGTGSGSINGSVASSTSTPIGLNATTSAAILGNSTISNGLVNVTSSASMSNVSMVSTSSINSTTTLLVNGTASISTLATNGTVSISTLAPLNGTTSLGGNGSSLSTVSGNVSAVTTSGPISNVTQNSTSSIASGTGSTNVTVSANTTAAILNATSSLGLTTGNSSEASTGAVNATTIASNSSMTSSQSINGTTSASIINSTLVQSTIANSSATSIQPNGNSTELGNVTTSASISNVSIVSTTSGSNSSTSINGNATTTVSLSTLESLGSGQPLINSTSTSASNFSTTVNELNSTISQLATTVSGGNVTSSNGVNEISTSGSLGGTTTQNMVSHPPISNTTGSGQQVNSSVFDCSNLAVGIYGNPKQACDTKFFICVDSSTLAYEQPCPARLYFDGEEKICDSWIHIPACSGKSRPPTPSTLAPSNTSMSTAAPVVDCKNKTDGNYPDPIGESKPFCSNKFYVCIGGISIPFKCPVDLVYDHDHDQCLRPNRVPACGQSNVTEVPFTNPPPVTLPKVNFDCRNRQDGYYANKCSNEFFSCNGGQARSLNCPAGLIFDPDMKRCDVPSNTMICTGSSKAPTTRGPTTESSNGSISTTPSPMKCSNVSDGIYPDPTTRCSHHFYFCAHNVPFQGVCPANLFYDVTYKKCDLWLNVFECSGLTPTSASITTRTPPPVFPTVDFDCTHSEDGNYVNPKNKCSKFFYMCANMEAFKQYCPANLYYDPDRNTCDSWQHVFACSGKTEVPSTIRPSTASLLSTEKPVLDCSTKLDGNYENPTNHCSNIYYRCVGGQVYPSECPSKLFYDIDLDQCDLFDNVPACSHVTHTPTRPSTSAGISTSSPSTVKPILDCMSLNDGDYADPSKKCSSTYITCASGFTFVRDCPKGTYFDADSDRCDTFDNVASCTGKPRISTASPPVTKHTERPIYPFDCTKKYDGNYEAGDCSQEFWSCVGGLTFPRHCMVGLVFDEDMDDCGFPFMIPKCGGVRPKSTLAPNVTTTESPSSLFCAMLVDGNYPDPSAKDGCGTKFLMCANGIGTLLPCPNDLFYDHVVDACNRREDVQACGGHTEVLTSTISSNSNSSQASISTTSSSSNVSISTTSISNSSSLISTTSISANSSISNFETTSAIEGNSTSVLPISQSTVTTNGSVGPNMTSVAFESTLAPNGTTIVGNLTTPQSNVSESTTSSNGNLVNSTMAVSSTQSLGNVSGTPSIGNVSTTIQTLTTSNSNVSGTTLASNATTLSSNGTTSVSNGTTLASNATTSNSSQIVTSTQSLVSNSNVSEMSTIAFNGTTSTANSTSNNGTSTIVGSVTPSTLNSSTVSVSGTPSIGNGSTTVTPLVSNVSETTVASNGSTIASNLSTSASNLTGSTMASNLSSSTLASNLNSSTTNSINSTTVASNLTGSTLASNGSTTATNLNISTSVSNLTNNTTSASNGSTISGSEISSQSTIAINGSHTTIASSGSSQTEVSFHLETSTPLLNVSTNSSSSFETSSISNLVTSSSSGLNVSSTQINNITNESSASTSVAQNGSTISGSINSTSMALESTTPSINGSSTNINISTSVIIGLNETSSRPSISVAFTGTTISSNAANQSHPHSHSNSTGFEISSSTSSTGPGLGSSSTST